MDLIFFGMQGSGKGTQARITEERYNMSIFETGAQLRKLANEDSELGKKVKEIIESGNLVPNDIVMEIVGDFFYKLPHGKQVIFDGIPRKMIQAETLEILLNENNREYMGVNLKISKDVAMERLTKRRICEDCKTVYPANYEKDSCEKCGGKLITRSDDNPEVIEKRINVFLEETMPVIEKFENDGKLININAEQDIEAVAKEFFEKLDPYFL